MALHGHSLIGFSQGSNSNGTFSGMNPVTGAELPELFYTASAEDVDRAATLAKKAFETYSTTSGSVRAAFLRAIANELEAVRPLIAERVPLETGLPEGRANGELGRTIGQLRMFADLVEEGSWVDARLETAQPDRAPVPKPDLRSMHISLGPVAVFGASNFPLAFSVAGGDTASALAAGCPVVCVAHYAHPGVSELAGQAILRAIKACNLPEGVFSLLQGTGQEVGTPLVAHPAIKAVGFTGSRLGGLALSKIAAARKEPIPVFAEMSSINPVILLEGALSERSESLAAGLTGSVGLGVGQFCTNPGLVLLPEGDAAEAFVTQFSTQMDSASGGVALHAGIAAAYATSIEAKHQHGSVETLVAASPTKGAEVEPSVFRTTAAALLQDEALAAETFGPSTTLITYADTDELVALIASLEGQLSGTIQYAASDLPLNDSVVSALRNRVGRLLLNGFPTGVEVCAAMVHGGPFPATTDGRSTSVGTLAIHRFTRPFCYQSFVSDALPAELKDGNPLGIWRLVDGKRTQA
ncbi:MAG: aldehyde dehydrogenase (NADP(+)) [Bacteroidetes Order II. Incertae sedis bacterium]|nr:aldehyde dehydrogenase (NADP(+)) [Bacteroidetes Order II. bacterium]